MSNKTGIELIAEERARQISDEKWDEKHDDDHTGGELAMAAACYAAPEPIFTKDESQNGSVFFQDPFPWNEDWDKRRKHNELRRLVIAGALIAAEIDRLQREQKYIDEAAPEEKEDFDDLTSDRDIEPDMGDQ